MPNLAVKTGRGRNHATADSTSTRLLTEFSPVAIEGAFEHGRALKAATQLMETEQRLPAETSLLKLLVILIENFEQKRFSLGEASPLDSLKELVRAREMQAKDLWQVFGSKGIMSEVLNGKRRISNEMAGKLGEMVHVSPAIFVWIHPAPSGIDEKRLERNGGRNRPKGRTRSPR